MRFIRQQYSLQIFLLFPAIFCEKHKISKRSLLFPQYTILQFTYGVSAPLILPKRSINLSLCVQCNFELPFNTTQWYPTVVSARAANELDYENDYDLDRYMFYKYIIGLLEGFGLNGEKCLQRSICEIAEIPMHIEESNSLLENAVHYLFTPSEDFVASNLIDNSSLSNPYLDAEMYGQKNGKCYDIFPECPFSLVDLFTKIFQV